MLKAVTRSARHVDARVAEINTGRQARGQTNVSIASFFDHYATESDTQVLVIEEDFEQAKAELVPSVSMDELRHYERVRDTFEGTAKHQTLEAPQKEIAQSGDKAAAKSRMAELIARRQASKKSQPINGGDVIKDFAARPPPSKHVSDSDDDEYVVRTEQMSINGTSQRSPVKGKVRSKGKGREKDHNGSAGRIDRAEEDLYD